jgi:hypothetical protein
MADQLVGHITQIFDGATGGRTARWSAANFVDKVLFCNPSVADPQYWPGSGVARPIPGLPRTSGGWDGVSVFAGHVILWHGSTIKHASVDDFALWIPVAATAAVGRALTVEEFIQPVEGADTDWIRLHTVSGTFVKEQFVRVVSNESDPTLVKYDYYVVSDVALSASQHSVGIGVGQLFEAGATGVLYTRDFVDWGIGVTLSVDDDPTSLVTLEKSRQVTTNLELADDSSPVPNVGETMTLPLTQFPFDLKTGDVISVGPSAGPGQDLYEVVTLGLVLVVKRLGVGTSMSNTGAIHLAGTKVSFQPWVKVENTGTEDITVVAGATVKITDALKLRNQDLTGSTAPEVPVIANAIVETLDANSAGEILNVGSEINGDVWQVVPLNEYAVIFKHKSIQSMLPVGRDNGVFFIQSEVLEEGLIGRYAWCRIEDTALALWGNKDMYIYRGGKIMEPFGEQHTNEVFKDLDRSRADEIIGFHNEPAREVWFIYPSLETGTSRVFIYNYEEKTSVVDDYESSLNGLTAAGILTWEVAPTWESLPVTEKWNSQNKKWYEFSDGGEKPYVLLGIVGSDANPLYGEQGGTVIPRLLVHGRTYSRTSRDDCNPDPYECLAETPDLDFGDSMSWKYIDTVQIGLTVAEPLPEPLKLEIYVGARANLDSDIKWAGPQVIEVSGNSNPTTKVNIRNSGRLIRLRFRSNQENVQWRISFYRIVGRIGGTF